MTASAYSDIVTGCPDSRLSPNPSRSGQITRHRISDAKASPDSVREYTRLNYRFGGGSANLADFGVLRFLE